MKKLKPAQKHNNTHEEFLNILQSKSKFLTKKLDEYLQKNPSAAQAFNENQYPYICVFLSKKFKKMNFIQKQFCVDVVKVFLQYDTPLFVPFIKNDLYYINFLDFVVMNTDFQFSQMVSPFIIQKMLEKDAEKLEVEMQKIDKYYTKSFNIEQTLGLEFVQKCYEKILLNQSFSPNESNDSKKKIL